MDEAGVPVEAAWTAGARVAGEFLGVPRLGTVRAGAPADLLILAADPSRDLDVLPLLQGMVAPGRLYAMDVLEAALARHRAQFERPGYNAFSTTLVRLGARLMQSSR